MSVPPSSSTSWTRRPFLAGLARAVPIIAPLVGGLVFVALLAPKLPPTDQLWQLLLRWAVFGLLWFVSVAVAHRLLRRFAPLATLLELSLVFPGEAPSRWAVARTRTSDDELRRRIQELRRVGLPEDPTRAAHEVLDLVAALSLHDHTTRGHAERVRAYTRLIVSRLEIDEQEADRIQWAALLHDIGKLVIPGEILNKPGALDDDEWAVMRTHPEEGARIVAPLSAWLGDAVQAVSQHHERWDGRGYPNGLAGEDISLAARIISVADVFDVITAKRSYKEPRSAADARRELVRCAGTQFDERIVRAFLEVSLLQLWWVIGPLSWLAQLPLLARLSLSPAGAAAATGGSGAAAAAGIGALVVLASPTPSLGEPPRPPAVEAAAQHAPDDAQLAPSAAPSRDAPPRGESTEEHLAEPGNADGSPAPEAPAPEPDRPSEAPSQSPEDAHRHDREEVAASAPPSPATTGTAPETAAPTPAPTTRTSPGTTAPSPAPTAAAPPAPASAPIARDDVGDRPDNPHQHALILGNDSDPDGDLDPLTARIVSGPSSGTVNLTGDVSPRMHYHAETQGTVSVVYEVCDRGGRCSRATVRFTYAPQNGGASRDPDTSTSPQPATEPGGATGPASTDPKAGGDGTDSTTSTAPAPSTPAPGGAPEKAKGGR